jgi:hypothetical protein
MADQIGRFERWRRKLGPDTAFFVDGVFDRIVPLFLARGFVRLTDYGGPGNLDASLARCLALQRQSAAEWPTVVLRFADLGRPFLVVDFAWLPESCLRWEDRTPAPISRSVAKASEGLFFFRLMRRKRFGDKSSFGISSIWPLFWRLAKLRREIEELTSLSLWLIEILSQEIPSSWISLDLPNRVHEHAWRQRGSLSVGQGG